MTVSLPAASLSTRRARLSEKAADISAIQPSVETGWSPSPAPGEVVVELRAAAVNPSDCKAATGLMPYAVFPRTPGRDFAGVVVAGDAVHLGREVFGSSGNLGIRRDGTHASHVVVPAEGLVDKPAGLTFAEAAGIGVPFVTAIEGFRRAGLPKSGDWVLIMGVNGKVGQAAAQIATWRGARVIGVVRRAEPYQGHATAEVPVIDASAEDVAARVREMTGGHGVDIVFNTVGDPYFADAHKSLAKLGRQILIAVIKPVVEFNIFEFYRGRHSYYGIDTLALSCEETGAVLRELLPGFESGALRPFPVKENALYSLEQISEAYQAVMGSSKDRVFILPDVQP